jgi:hypothetical protein
MEDTLKLPTGDIPPLPPKDVPADIIEAWRVEWRLDMHRHGLLAKIAEAVACHRVRYSRRLSRSGPR